MTGATSLAVARYTVESRRLLPAGLTTSPVQYLGEDAQQSEIRPHSPQWLWTVENAGEKCSMMRAQLQLCYPPTSLLPAWPPVGL